MREQHISPDKLVFHRFADIRYLGQEHTVKTPVPAGQLEETALQEIIERFHELHQQAYAFRLDAPVELVNYHLSCFGMVDKPEIGKLQNRGVPLSGSFKESLNASRKDKRSVNFDELGFQISPVYERDTFPAGQPVQGPLVIEEPSSTTVVFPDQHVIRDEYGFLHIENR
jgi:N-methylhydantoinase A